MQDIVTHQDQVRGDTSITRTWDMIDSLVGLLGFAAGTPVWFAVTARDIFNNIVPETDPGIFTVSLQMVQSRIDLVHVDIDERI